MAAFSCVFSHYRCPEPEEEVDSSRKITMTIPSRPAPAPPPPGSNGNPHRYTPTTDWDDRPFENAAVQKSSAASGIYKKVPPPRPPPPKANPTAGGAGFQALKKSSQPPQSINILSNLFGTKRSKTPPTNLAPPPSKVHLNRTNKFNHNKVIILLKKKMIYI